MVINQYNIFWIDLNPTQGSEINKIRPCLIISPDESNKYLKTVIIAPLTSKSKEYPTRIKIELDNKSGFICLDQIRTIDKTRIKKKIKTLEKEKIKEVKNKLKEFLVD